MEISAENNKERLDVLVSRVYSFSREYSKQAIETGNVFVDGKLKIKPGEKIDVTSDVTVAVEKMKYVSRGGLKLEKALDFFNINAANKVCIDVGASTGGFTDCLLQNGALKIYAVDTGLGQLSARLLSDDKVVSMEKTNIRDLDLRHIKEEIQFIAVDVSFVSITKIMEAVGRLLSAAGEVVLLIKPQFEVGKNFVGRSGVVKDPAAHKKVIKSIYSSMCENGINPLGLTFSPIKGQNGNIEYLIHGNKKDRFHSFLSFKALIDSVVFEAFAGGDARIIPSVKPEGLF